MGDFISGFVWYICCGWLVIGAFAGAFARRVMRRENSPLVLDIVLGVAGAFVGGIIVSLLELDDVLDIGFGIGSLITALIGAMVLLFIGDYISRLRK